MNASQELSGSGVCGALIDDGDSSLNDGGNADAPGRFRFQVRNGAVMGSNTVVPEPSTHALIAVGLCALGVFSRRRRAR